MLIVNIPREDQDVRSDGNGCHPCQSFSQGEGVFFVGGLKVNVGHELEHGRCFPCFVTVDSFDRDVFVGFNGPEDGFKLLLVPGSELVAVLFVFLAHRAERRGRHPFKIVPQDSHAFLLGFRLVQVRSRVEAETKNELPGQDRGDGDPDAHGSKHVGPGCWLAGRSQGVTGHHGSPEECGDGHESLAVHRGLLVGRVG
jgi:hypothetical protein